MISLDTTRADHLGFYGNRVVQTPQLDALAAESVVLDDFMTVVPTTLASHASLFTGKYPHHHGVPRNGFVVPEENVMLTELLAERGFTTAGFIGAFPLAERFRFAQGFEHWDEQFSAARGRRAEGVTDARTAWLDEKASRAPVSVRSYFDPTCRTTAPGRSTRGTTSRPQRASEMARSAEAKPLPRA